ncbi:MAG: energy-coupling factor transporter transmembrane protein EcfT [Clostridia bacterium]|nr:energy-coupling factor transporter transmembrane protein EcfT [Clostridia bacterium]
MPKSSEHKSAFAAYHPAVVFAYFLCVIVAAMLFMHPLALASSLLAALAYTTRLKSGRPPLSLVLTLALTCALLNPLFNHRGVSLLFRLPGGAAVTMEAILYGLAAAAMLAAVLYWFSLAGALLTSDKLIFLFGRAAPAFSLLFTMGLRSVPRFARQARRIAEAEQGLGRDFSHGPLRQRLRLLIKIISILITWALENSIETADSMKSRGYGLPGRSSFSLWRWRRRDTIAILLIVISGGWLMAAAACQTLAYGFFPRLTSLLPNAWGGSALIAYALLLLLPWGCEIAARRGHQRSFNHTAGHEVG